MQLVIISTQHKVDEQKNDDPHVLPFYLTGASWTQKDYAEHYGFEMYGDEDNGASWTQKDYAEHYGFEFYGDEDNVFVPVSSNRAKRKKNTYTAASIKISNRFEALQFSTMSYNFIVEDNEVENGTDDFIVEDNEGVNGTDHFNVEDVEVENGIQENYAIDILSEIISTVVDRSIPTENLVSDKSHQTHSANKFSSPSKKPKKKRPNKTSKSPINLLQYKQKPFLMIFKAAKLLKAKLEKTYR